MKMFRNTKSVIAIILWLVLIGVCGSSVFVHKTSSAAPCANRLMEIQGWKAQWALEHRNAGKDVPTWVDLRDFTGGRIPVCPKGGVYSLGRVDENPTCSIGTEAHRCWGGQGNPKARN